MELKLLNYRGEEKIVDIGDINDIAIIDIKVVTGDEIARVIYKDYTIEEFDSCYTRTADYSDGEYRIYDFGNEKNLIDNPRFMGRTDSYDYLYGGDEEEEP